MTYRKYWLQLAGLGMVGFIASIPASLGAADAKGCLLPVTSASPKGGVFATNVVVTLSTTCKEVRYTLDGSEPATNSPLYTAPLLVTNSVLLQARAFSADSKSGDTLVETYVVVDTNAVDFTSTLPVVVINTFGRPIQPGTNLVGAMRFINTATNQRAMLTAPVDFDGRASIKARGYTSLRYPKKSYAFETRDKSGETKAASILGFPQDTEWILYAPYPDKTLLRDVLAYELSNKAGHYASRTRFVEAFVNETTNKLSRAHYAGVYVLEEKMKRGDKRVAIQKLAAGDQAEPNITGGYIFKKDHLEEAAGEPPAEVPGRSHGPAGWRGNFPTGPGGFPADPAGFPPPHPPFTNALSVVTNLTTITNTVASTNVTVSVLAVTVVCTNSVAATNTVAVTNSVIATNIVVATNSLVITNSVVATRAVVATNLVVASNAVVGTNAVATTNIIDANTAVVTTTVATITSTTYRTNRVVATNTLASTNLLVATNIVFATNSIVSTNLTVTAVPVLVTNRVLVTNVFVLSSQRAPLLEQLVSTGHGFVTHRTNAFFYVEPKASRISSAQRKWLLDYVNRFEEVLHGPDFRNPTNGYAAYIDVDSFIDHHLFVEATKNIDGFRFSTFFTKDRGGKIRMDPIWDWDLSFGNAKGKQGYLPEHWYWPQLDDQQYSWFRRLFEDPDFGQRYVDRWAQWRTNFFAAPNLLARVDELAASLKEPAARNFERWPTLGVAVGPEHFLGKTYDDEIQYMKGWITNRLAWMNSQFVSPPSPSTTGGTQAGTNVLTFSAPAGQVYFTMDGTDPRAGGGAVSAVARPYQAPVALTNTVTITARTQKENRWSNPVTVRIVLLHVPPPTGG
jgi:hypothetical protein